MNNETCTVTIADIYGAEWWERNKAELDREWEWEFGVADKDVMVSSIHGKTLFEARYNELTRQLRIILHRRKPKPPTLRDVYGVDEVTIPAGWEWTGEWRLPTVGEYSRYIGGNSVMDCGGLHKGNEYRLILRERPKKVWYRAEEPPRTAYPIDWVWCPTSVQWVQWGAAWPSCNPYLCATRHEEIDQTVQVVTQADIDKVTK